MKQQFQWTEEKILHREAVDVGFLVPLFYSKEPILKSPWWSNGGFLTGFMILSWFDRASAEQMLSLAGSRFVYSQPPPFLFCPLLFESSCVLT